MKGSRAGHCSQLPDDFSTSFLMLPQGEGKEAGSGGCTSGRASLRTDSSCRTEICLEINYQCPLSMPWEATARNDVSVVANPKESGSRGIRVKLWFCSANSDLLMGYQKLQALHYEGLLRKDLLECTVSYFQGFSLVVRLHVELRLYGFSPG